MEKVRLSKSEVADNEMDLIEKMITTAHEQGFDVKWVDGVISKIEKTGMCQES